MSFHVVVTSEFDAEAEDEEEAGIIADQAVETYIRHPQTGKMIYPEIEVSKN